MPLSNLIRRALERRRHVTMEGLKEQVSRGGRVQVSSQSPAQRPTTAGQLTMGNASPSPFESDNNYSTKSSIYLVATKYLAIATTVATAMRGTATVAMVPPWNVALRYSSPMDASSMRTRRTGTYRT